MQVKPHSAATYMTPDQIAECVNGVYSAGNLYETLWDLTQYYDQSYMAVIEDIGPHDVIGINSVASFWDKLSEEHQTKINELLQAHDDYIENLVKGVA